MGNLFSKQQVVNVLKLMLLSTIMGWTGWHYLSGSFQEIASLLMQPSAASVMHLVNWIVKGLSLMLLTVFAAAVIDVPLQKYFFANKLKMSHDEVKRENKDSEGNPQVKGKLRAKQREMAQRRSISNVPKADFVVMNPTHFAVALKYDEATMAAPQVIAKGADLLAFKIREVANSHSVPVLQSSHAGPRAVCPCRAGPDHPLQPVCRRGPGAGLCVPPQGRHARSGPDASAARSLRAA